MAADLRVVAALPEHIAPIASSLRQADRDELAAASGRSPHEALELSLSRSSISGTILIDGRPAGMFGCGDISILTRAGAPWLLGTDDLALAPVAFLRASIAWRDMLLRQYDTLRNAVDDRNAASVRWLRWLGFELQGPYPVGREKLLFWVFERRRGE